MCGDTWNALQEVQIIIVLETKVGRRIKCMRTLDESHLPVGWAK